MSETPSKAGPLVIGMLIGLFAGWLATVSMTGDKSKSEPKDPSEEPKVAKKAEGPNPHAKGPNPHTKSDNPHSKGPHAKDPGKPSHGAGADRAQASIAKVHFMKKFVEALKQTPENKWPAAGHKALLKEGAALNCSDCHDPSKVNMEGMMTMDPGSDAVNTFRKNPNFMIPLMQKWVARLNKDHGDRLEKRVTCADCHAISPVEAWNSLPPLMVSFVKALKNKPTNKQPASRWKPLLKTPGTQSMLCGTCHGEIGKAMERQAKMFEKSPRPAIADDRAFMVTLMERWVEKLNRDAKDQLTKPVTCLDCHETEPKR